MEDDIENEHARRRRREAEWALPSSDDHNHRRHHHHQHDPPLDPPVSTESTHQPPSLFQVYTNGWIISQFRRICFCTVTQHFIHFFMDD